MQTMKIFADMPVLFRFTLIMCLMGLLATITSFAFPGPVFGLLPFCFCASWLLSIMCIFSKVQNKLGGLPILWVTIDLSILLYFLSVTASTGDVSGSPGTEMVWGLAYFPFLLVGFVESHFLPTGLDNPERAFNFALSWFGDVYGRIVAEWLTFSCMAAIQLVLIVMTLWLWQKCAPTRKMHRGEKTSTGDLPAR